MFSALHALQMKKPQLNLIYHDEIDAFIYFIIDAVTPLLHQLKRSELIKTDVESIKSAMKYLMQTTNIVDNRRVADMLKIRFIFSL